MTKEQFAEIITGREYPFEITNHEKKVARENQLLVLHGASDDLFEIDGAETDETGAPGIVCLDKNGKIMPTPDDDEREVLLRFHVLSEVESKLHGSITIDIRWCETADVWWMLHTTTPHATFDIMEDGALFCRGLVIDLKECGA